MSLPAPTPIEGICSACGCSIPLGAHYQTAHMPTTFMYGMRPLPPIHLCESCLTSLVDSELKYRLSKDSQFLSEYRRARLAEHLPKTLFPLRRAHRMKELLMLQPMGPRVLVKRVDAPKPTSSTIIIPETIDGEASHYAVVLAVGNKVTENIKVADTVVLMPYCGSPVQVELDGEMLDAQIVMESDVIAVVDES